MVDGAEGTGRGDAVGVLGSQLAAVAELLATRAPALAGGSVAATAATLAAALITMTARLSIGRWETAVAAAAQIQAPRPCAVDAS